MKNLAINTSTGALLKKSNNMQKVTGLEALAQNINSYLKTHTGEIITDENLGIPWVTVMMSKRIDIDFKNTIIKNAILSRPFVEAIKKYESYYDTTGGKRKLKIYAEIQSNEGVFGLQSELEAG